MPSDQRERSQLSLSSWDSPPVLTAPVSGRAALAGLSSTSFLDFTACVPSNDLCWHIMI